MRQTHSDQKAIGDKGYYPYLQGYILPLVIEALENKQVGTPRVLQDIQNTDQRGPLNVTLATELSSVVVSLLAPQLEKNEILEERERLIENRGGVQYLNKKRELVNIRNRIIETINKGSTLEDYLVTWNIADIVGNTKVPGEKINCINGGYIRSRSSLKKTPKKTDFCGEKNARWLEYKDLAAAYNELIEENNRLISSLKSDYDALTREASFENDINDRLASKGIRIDKRKISFIFNNSDRILDGGATRILRQNDQAWWDRFTFFITHEINKKFNGGLIEIYLRHGFFIEKVRPISENILFDIVLLEALKAPQDFVASDLAACVGKCGNHHNDDDLRQWYTKLRKKDVLTLKWLKEEGGVFHPCSFLDRDKNRSEITKMRLKYQDYSIEQATNELYWCLSRFNQDLFHPISNSRYSVSRWRNWMKDFEDGKVGYWTRK